MPNGISDYCINYNNAKLDKFYSLGPESYKTIKQLYRHKEKK